MGVHNKNEDIEAANQQARLGPVNRSLSAVVFM